MGGSLRRAAAMWRLAEACRDGELPFRAEEIANSTGSSHLLHITSGPFEAHMMRTASSGAFPKDAPIRQDRRLTNEPTLFDKKIVSFRELVAKIKKSYAWLAFNATPLGVLTHVCWGMPDRTEDKYLAHFDIFVGQCGWGRLLIHQPRQSLILKTKLNSSVTSRKKLNAAKKTTTTRKPEEC